MLPATFTTMNHEQPRRIARLGGLLGDQLFGKPVIVIAELIRHPSI